jgi:hypothetical protein
VIVCDSIRRFKGLEKPVVVLVELRPDDERLERLLYIAASRARQHLVIVAPGLPSRGISGKGRNSF